MDAQCLPSLLQAAFEDMGDAELARELRRVTDSAVASRVDSFAITRRPSTRATLPISSSLRPSAIVRVDSLSPIGLSGTMTRLGGVVRVVAVTAVVAIAGCCVRATTTTHPPST